MSSASAVGISLATVLVSFLVVKIVRLRRAFFQLGSCPGKHVILISPFDSIAFTLFSIFPPRGWFGNFEARFSNYAKEGSTILSSILIWTATPVYWIADLQALKLVTSDRYTFTKDTSDYERAEPFGRNIVSTEGEEWRRHAAVAAPAFSSNATYELVWQEARRVMHELFSSELQNAQSRERVNMKAKMAQATLHIIASAGFGIQTNWAAYDTHGRHEADAREKSAKVTTPQDDGEQQDLLPFHTSLLLSVEHLLPRAVVPEILYTLPISIPWLSTWLKEIQCSFASMEVHMRRLIDTYAREEDTVGADVFGGGAESPPPVKADLLRRLVRANQVAQETNEGVIDLPSKRRSLTEDEILSNIFMFLLAGHETSANTLSFAIAALAVYPDIQQKLREESLRVWPTLDDVLSSTYNRDLGQFEYTLAFFRETLRCFPIAPRLLKTVTKDTILPGTRFAPIPDLSTCVLDESFDGDRDNVQVPRDLAREETFSVNVPAGSLVVVDIKGLHMNPIVWGDDAHLFRPGRFIDTEDYKWPRDGFLTFSAGPHGCIGSRFAIAESVCILAMLVRHFAVRLPEGLNGTEQCFDREAIKRFMLKGKPWLTVIPENAIVRLEPYEK